MLGVKRRGNKRTIPVYPDKQPTDCMESEILELFITVNRRTKCLEDGCVEKEGEKKEKEPEKKQRKKTHHNVGHVGDSFCLRSTCMEKTNVFSPSAGLFLILMEIL